MNRIKMVMIAGVFSGWAVPALAQQAPDCTVAVNDSTLQAVAVPPVDPEPSLCGRQAIGRQLLINNIDIIPKMVAESFGVGPSSMEPAGLGSLTPDEAAARLHGGEKFVISPTADLVATAPLPKWNAWVDGKYTWNDNSPAISDLDGPLWNGIAGFDYKLTDKVIVGIMGSYEESSLEGAGAGLASDGWGIGPYLGIVLTENIVFSANVLGSLVDTQQTGPLNFDSERIQATAGLNGYWFADTWRFTPGLTGSWSKEWMEEDAGAALDQNIELGMLTPSLQIGNTLRLSDTTTVEPWAGAALDWAFINRIEQDGAPDIDDPNVDLRAQFGLNFGFGGSAQLALTGEAGGLLLDSIDTWSGQANLAIQF